MTQHQSQWHNNKRQSDGGKTKDVPLWLHKSGGTGYQHVGMAERQSVGIFLTSSHHRLTSDSWDKTLSFPRYVHMKPWANVRQTHQPFVSNWIICILNIMCLHLVYYFNILNSSFFVHSIAFTNRFHKYFQTLFLQHPPVQGDGKWLHSKGEGLLTPCTVLTCCRRWPVECPAEPGMWRLFRCKATRISCGGSSDFSWTANDSAFHVRSNYHHLRLSSWKPKTSHSTGHVTWGVQWQWHNGRKPLHHLRTLTRWALGVSYWFIAVPPTVCVYV